MGHMERSTSSVLHFESPKTPRTRTNHFIQSTFKNTRETFASSNIQPHFTLLFPTTRDLKQTSPLFSRNALALQHKNTKWKLINSEFIIITRTHSFKNKLTEHEYARLGLGQPAGRVHRRLGVDEALLVVRPGRALGARGDVEGGERVRPREAHVLRLGRLLLLGLLGLLDKGGRQGQGRGGWEDRARALQPRRVFVLRQPGVPEVRDDQMFNV